jgi:type IV fimbrial biogenesis protein FimT
MLGGQEGRDVLNKRHTSRGMTLVELMVVVTLIGIMLMLAVPGIGNWIANSRVRSVAEDVQNGLRMAQAEAVNRNRQVAFVRTNATPALDAAPAATGTNWYVQVLPGPGEAGNADFVANAYVQGGSFSTQNKANVSGPTMVCFNAVGRVINVSATDTALGDACVAPTDAANPSDFDVVLTGTTVRRMRIELFLGGRVRLCDVDAASTQPNACTP